MENNLLLLSLLLLLVPSSAQMPGFVSLDCGGEEFFTDDLGLNWSPDELRYGETGLIKVWNETRKQYTSLRHFPADSRKYCYTLNVTSRTRYLIRATFLYGFFDYHNVFPSFDISLGATHWSTIVILDAYTLEMRELIFLATSPTVSVCLSNARTGQPFISTLELRQFNGSVYFTDYEQRFYLSVSARINFGANSEDPIRYPDDPFDRIWLSDSIKKADYLVDIAAGTKKVATKLPIDVNRDELPPQKVMQTAVVGTNGSLTYRLNLDGFPGTGWAVFYFAEIEDLAPDESRKFRLVLPGNPELSKAIANIEENAQGKYRLYEPGFTNLSLPFVLSFRFGKTSDSTRGPLLNAMEINKYLEKTDGSQDGAAIASFISQYSSADWAQEGGDPCLPVPWSWVECNSNAQPRIVKIKLSSMNLTGNIPSDLTKLSGLVELWLDGNSLTGPVPDFSGFLDLKIIHLENNQLSSGLPSSLMDLPSLKELYVQSNSLSGTIPSGLEDKVIMNYTGNNLQKGKRTGSRKDALLRWIGIGISVVVVILALVLCSLFYLIRRRKLAGENQRKIQEMLNMMNSNRPTDTEGFQNDGKKGHDLSVFSYASVAAATSKFSDENKLGEGGFGPVYKGKLVTGQEVAVKRLSKRSGQGISEFKNELILIYELQHKNLVQLFGFCIHGEERILIYEYLPNKSLDYFLFDSTRCQQLDWNRRFCIIEGIAQGLLYLHIYSRTRIIHRDLKASNVLLDERMNPKISDFGLARIFANDEEEANTMKIVGTRGYMSPEYVNGGNFSTKSDVYSFGVLMLEILSGRKYNSFYNDDRATNLVGYAWGLWKQGAGLGLIDPRIDESCDKAKLLRCIHVGLLCVEENAADRPTMLDVIPMLTNESMSLPVPTKPAFCIERNVITAAIDGDGPKTVASVNGISISHLVGR